MASKNQVTLTFAGDTDQLDRAFKRVQAGADATGNAVAKASKKAEESTHGFKKVAEASDEIDTIGQKATSSLGALSSGFQLLGDKGEGAATALGTVALATDALSGAGEAATLVTENLRNAATKVTGALDNMSKSARIASIAGFGALGIAVAVAAIALAGWIKKSADAKKHTDAVNAAAQTYTDTLDKLTGATTIATRAKAFDNLQTAGAIRAAREFGISSRELIDASLGVAGAQKHISDVLAERLRTDPEKSLIDKAKLVNEQVSIQNDSIGESVHLFDDYKSAVGETSPEVDGLATATTKAKHAQDDFNQALHDQIDPASNYFHRLQDLKTAQKNYNDALKEHGPKSLEAKNALYELADAGLELNTAAMNATDGLSGHLTPALKNALEKAGLTKKEIKDLDDKTVNLHNHLNDLDGKNVKITVTETMIHQNRYARQDPEGRASGGNAKAGKTYWVGESGPELVTFGQDGYVHNATQSAAMVAGTGSSVVGGASQGNINVTLTIAPSSGNAASDFVIQEVQKAARQGRLSVKVS